MELLPSGGNELSYFGKTLETSEFSLLDERTFRRKKRCVSLFVHKIFLQTIYVSVFRGSVDDRERRYTKKAGGLSYGREVKRSLQNIARDSFLKYIY